MNFLLLLLQEEAAPVKTSNAMATHNWFVILAVGAFLLWSISYSLHLQKEALRRKKAAKTCCRARKCCWTELRILKVKRKPAKSVIRNTKMN